MSDTVPLAKRQRPLPAGWERLFAAVLSDALDAVGRTTQAMSPRIRPLDDTLRLCGRARTGLYLEDDGVERGVNPYELEIAIVDDLRPEDVAVFACNGSEKIAPWGGLLSTAARARGAAGCVTDGFVRDVQAIRRMRLPVFHGGIAPLDSKGRGHVAQIDVPVVCGGVEVSPGTWCSGMPTAWWWCRKRSRRKCCASHSTRSTENTTPCANSARASICGTSTPSTASSNPG